MTKFYERFDYVLKEVLNVSGNSVARSIGAHQGLVNRYRKGLTAPPVEFAQKFCEHYGVSANWLLLNTGPIMISDLIFDKDSSNRFNQEIQFKKQIKNDLLNLKKTVTEIYEKII